MRSLLSTWTKRIGSCFGWKTPKKKEESKKVHLEITVYRTGDDLQYVTMKIGDWYKLLNQLGESRINNRWHVNMKEE
jgi:hypothetical protein